MCHRVSSEKHVLKYLSSFVYPIYSSWDKNYTFLQLFIISSNSCRGFLLMGLPSLSLSIHIIVFQGWSTLLMVFPAYLGFACCWRHLLLPPNLRREHQLPKQWLSEQWLLQIIHNKVKDACTGCMYCRHAYTCIHRSSSNSFWSFECE